MRTKIGNGHHVELEKFVEDIKAVVRDSEELLKAGVSVARQRAIAGAKTTDRVVREHPYQSLGIIFGLGVLVGVLSYSLFTREDIIMEEER